MDLKKALKDVKKAILFFFISLGVTGLILIVTLIIVFASPNEASAIVITLLWLLTLGSTVPYLVFYIFSLINAHKDSKDETPFILLLVGLFVGIVGIIGLFLHKSRVETLISRQNQEKNEEESIYEY